MEDNNQYTPAPSGGMTFRQLLLILRANVFIIVAIIVIAALVGIVYYTTEKPEYSARHSLIVQCVKFNEETGKTENAMSTANLNTIVESCKQTVVIEEANRLYFGGEGAEGYAIFSSNLSVSYNSEQTSYYIYIAYTDSDRDEAAKKVNCLVEAASTVGAKLASEGLSMTVTFMEVNDDPDISAQSNAKLVLALCIVAGVIVAVLVVLFRYLLDDTVKTKEELERITGTKVFAFLGDPEELARALAAEKTEERQ